MRRPYVEALPATRSSGLIDSDPVRRPVMTPEINHLAVILAVVASMVVGFLFYMPAAFGRRWMEMVGHTDESVQTGGPPLLYPLVIVANLITGFALAGVAFLSHEFYAGDFFVAALI